MDSTARDSGSKSTAQPQPAQTAMATESFKGSIKYLGGPGFPDFKGKETWDNNLNLSGTEGVCSFADKTIAPVTFSLSSVTTIVYGQASSRHAGRWVAVGVLFAPIALFGLFHKQRKHNVLISWKSDAGQEGGVFLEVEKGQFRRLLNTLSYRTHKPVFADQEDRKWLLTQGVQAQLDPDAPGEKK